MSIFQKIRDSFRNLTQSTTAATNRNQNRNQDPPKTGTGRIVDNILTDIAIGVGALDESDVGQSGIDDYNRRTEETIKRMEEQKNNNRDKDRGSNKNEVVTPVVETVEEKEETPVSPVTPTDDPVKLTPETQPDTETEGENAPVTPDTGAGTDTAVGAEEEAEKLEEVATGDAEADVADTIRKTGRRSTIQTTPQGLLSSAPVRTRRSLMGGGLLR